MPAVIQRVNRVVARDEPRRDLRVAPAVLGEPVRDHDDGARVALGQPGLREQRDVMASG